MDNNIFLELSSFNNIKYIDSTHEYFYNKVKQCSVTTFIGKYKPHFDTEKEAAKYAAKHNLKYEDVVDSWNYVREYASLKGKTFHSYVENWYNNRIFEYDAKELSEKFGDSININIEKMIVLFSKFYSDSKETLVPIKSEFIVGDEEFGICGTIDQLFYNKKYNEFQLFDWKTNKNIDFENSYGNKFLPPVNHLDVCEFNTYSLQLSIYKYIIEKNTNIKIGNTYIVWFNELNEEYKIFKCKDYTSEFLNMVKIFKNN